MKICFFFVALCFVNFTTLWFLWKLDQIYFEWDLIEILLKCCFLFSEKPKPTFSNGSHFLSDLHMSANYCSRGHQHEVNYSQTAVSKLGRWLQIKDINEKVFFFRILQFKTNFSFNYCEIQQTFLNISLFFFLIYWTMFDTGVCAKFAKQKVCCPRFIALYAF